ncbi:agamous-like MADS-box protein AGL15 [Heracleum sosnowskyi]|uniref:Agamous-like MADS-box protein AGL15 n=1 Tax=Heracleum sosnowskyi TaxID=360622 RepID=A0AAD8H3W8_9APIA|nr:agamous-like MADS-box protein AGL15 [Heracleum sosnowskyi]
MDRQRKKQQIDELDSLVRLKQAEADMFDLKASEARRESERIHRIIAGNLFEFACSSMEQTLARYNKCVESSENSAVEHEVPKKDVQEVEHLKQEIADLQLKNMQILGKDLGTGLGLKELQQLEQLLNEGLLSVKGKKEQLLMEQLDLSRKRNRRSLWKMLLKPSEQSSIFHYDLSVIALSFPSKAALTAAILSSPNHQGPSPIFACFSTGDPYAISYF